MHWSNMEALSRTEPMALFICCYFSNFIAPIDALIESSSEAAGAASILLLVLDCIILIYLCGGVYRSAKNNFDSIVLVISILPSIALVICSSVNFLDEPLLMCLSLFRMVKVVLLRSQYKRAIQAIERQSVLINETSSRILLIALQSAIYASTLACIWFAISCNKLERSVCLDGSNWVAEDASSDLMNFSDPASQYFRSLHFVIQTLLTVGYGDIHPVNLHEALFSLVLILSGALFYGYVISCITSLLSSRDITTKLFRHDLTSLRNYLKLRKVEDSVRETYTAYLEFLYARQLGLSEETVLAALPEEISREIKLACCLTCLKSVPFFKMQPNSDSFAEKCVQRLRFVSYGPDSVVCALNSTERVLYLIRSGKVNLISQETRKPILSLIDGDYLGDYHLVFGFPVEVEAVSAGFTEVAILSFYSLVEVLESCGGPIIARQQRTSLVQFTAELQQFTSNKDSHKDNGEAPLSVIAELGEVPEDLGSPVSSGLPLSVVRLKPLPVVGNRRPRNSGSTAVIAPVSEKLEVDDTPVYPKRGSDLSQGAATCMMSLLTTTSSGTNQVVRLSDSSGLRVSGGPSSVRKTPPAHYRSSLRATFDAHQALLKRMEKTQASIAQTARTKRLAAMMEQQEATTQSFVVRPDHYFRCTWDVCLALVVLYYNLTIPMRIMARFQCDPSDEALNSLYGADACLSRWDWSLLIDYLCDALLVADFVLRAQFFAFRRFEGEREIVEIDRQAIWCVFRPTFRCLVLAGVIFPIDLFAPLTGYLLVLRVTKLPSVLLLTTIIQDIQQWLDHERGVSISAEAITVTHLTLFTIISTCWMSVGWCIQHYGGAQSFSWVSAFYWCLTTMTTTGYGDITPADTSETIYNIVITIVGPTIFATIIAKFASYVKKVDASTSNMEHRLSTVSQFVRCIHPSGADSGEDPQVAGVESSQSLNLQSAAAAMHPLSPFAQELDVLNTNADTRTESASCKVDTSEVPQLFRALSGISTGIGAGALTAMREIAARSTTTANTVSRAFNGAAVAMKYRPSQDTRSKAGVEAAVEDFFSFMDRSGQQLVEDLALPVGSLATHMQIKLRGTVLENLVAAIPIFAQCDKAFQQEIMMALQQLLYSRKAVLVDRAVPEGLYIVKTGSVRVQEVTSGAVPQSRHAGQCFAEHALFSRSAQTTLEVSARTDCELWFLSRTSFEKIIKSHPKKDEYMKNIVHVLLKPPALLARQQSMNVSTSISASSNRRPLVFATAARRANAIVHASDVISLTQRLKQESEQETLIIYPDGSLGMSWTFLLTLVTMYNFIVIPLRIAFFQGCEMDGFFALDYTGDLLYVLDIALRMYCFAYYERDDLVKDRNKIRAYYIKTGRVYGDILSVLPFDLIALAGPLGTMGVAQVLSLFRINRLVRLRDANSGFVMLEASIVKWLKSKSRSQKNSLRLVKLIATIFLIAHVFGCCFFLIANQLRLVGDDENWAENAGLFASSRSESGPLWSVQPSAEQIFTQYIASVYWAIALLTTVGYGDISPVNDWEKAYNILLFVIGTMVYAMVIVHLQDIVSELDVTSDIFKGRVRNVQAFLLREQVGAEYSAKVSAYMDKLWSAQRGAQSEEIQTFMPPALYCATVNSCLSKHLPQLFFVQKCHAAFQRAFLSKLKAVHYLKDEYVFRTSEAAHKLYFIGQGEVSLVSMDLQTADTAANAADVGPMRKRNSLLQTIAGRRVSLQVLTSKAPTIPASASSATSAVGSKRFTFTSFRPPRSSLLSRQGATDASGLPIGGAAAAAQQFQRKTGNKRTSYQKVHDGFIGETEFFTRACYSCSAKVNTDAILFEIDFDTFWELVLHFDLQSQYKKVLKKDTTSLHRNSTLSVVQKLDTNMANKKMARMMSVCVVEAPQVHSILPGSLAAQLWNALTLAMLILMAVFVPYFTAFPRIQSVVLQLTLDSLVTAVFAADIYLRMHVFAVLDDGVTISDPVAIKAHYMRNHMQVDAAATFPLALLVFAASQNIPAYSAIRWLFLLRLNKVSFLLDSAITSICNLVGRTASEGNKRVLIAVLAVLYIAHVSGCLFCLIGRLELQSGGASWLSANEWQDSEDVSKYVRAYYWALYTLTTVGYGSVAVPTNMERVFAIAVMVLGSILNAMLSALLSSMVESSDQSTGLIRRAAEAASKFCRSNQVDACTQSKVSAYYKYLSENLNSSPDEHDFALLSSSLRSELVLRTAWRSLRRIAYLDTSLYDKAHQHGFILSLSRKMQVYLAVPGQVLASAPLSLLLAEQAQQLRSRDSSATSAAAAAAVTGVSASKKERRQRKKLQLFYKGMDMLILRRGAVVVSLDDTGSDSVKENYFTAGQVVNMYTIANQLATGRSHYSAKCITNSSKSSGGDGVGSTDNGESHSPPPVLMLHILELNVQIGEREGIDAVPAYCELRCKASSSQGEKHIRSHTFMLTDEPVAAAFDAPVILRSGSDVCIDVFVQGGDSTESKLLCSAKVTAEDLLALNKQRSNTLQDFEESALSSSSSSSGLSSDSDCTDINVSEHDDDQCGQEQEHGVTAPAGRFYAVQDASMEAVVETYSISDSAAQEWDAECFSGSGATSDSDSEDESHNEPVQDLFEHALPAALQSTGSAQKQSGVSDVSNSSFSTSLKAGLSCRYNSVPLECISEESSVDNAEVCCGAVDSGASEAEVTFATDLHDASNKCTVGKVSLVFSLAAHSSAGIVDPPNGSQDRRSSNPRSSIMAATDSTPGLISAPEDRRASTASGESNEEDEGDNRQALVTVRAEGFSHFFRVTAAEFKEMEEYFRLSRMAVHQRL